MVGAVLFNIQIGPLTPILVVASVGAFVLLRWERLFPLFLESWPLLLLPVFACASAAWSEIPGTSIYYAVLFGLTIIAGIMMGGGTQTRSLVVGMFIAFAIYNITSTFLGRSVGWGEGAGDAFAGLAASKNAFGDFTGLAIISTLAALALFAKERRVLPVVACIALLPVMASNLLDTRATSALLATMAAVGCLTLLLVSRSLPLQARTGILVAALLASLVALVTLDFWLPPLFETLLEVTGKDEGLTGRVDLWAFGQTIMNESPLLGLGYNAFWVHGNPGAEYLWDMMGIGSRSGFSFHNTFIEIRIHNGWVGLVLFLAIWTYAAIRLLAKVVLTPTIGLITASAMVIFLALKLQFEVVGYSTMHFSTILLFAALALGLRTAQSKDPGLATSGARAFPAG